MTQFEPKQYKEIMTTQQYLVKLIKVASSKNVLSNMLKMRRFKSSCACIKYHPGLVLHSYIVWYSMVLLGDSEDPHADAQADLGLRCPHIAKHMYIFPVVLRFITILSMQYLSRRWRDVTAAINIPTLNRLVKSGIHFQLT